MTCFHPIQGWRSKHDNHNGKRNVVFNIVSADTSQPLTIPCGQCIGCRLDRSKQWAIRCVHESQLHADNAYITLTYDSDHLPADGSLRKDDFQRFMKRLRKHYSDRHIKYYMCGEYGTDQHQPTGLGRPHYHACLFGLDFSDKELYSTREGINLYTSETLAKIWGQGFVTVGDVTFESAAYVARYIAKKITGEMADHHYYKINYETGEFYRVIPEYNDMSRRPAIAREWWEQYQTDTLKDFVTHQGKRVKLPRYYDKLFESVDPDEITNIKLRRKIKAYEHFDDNSSDRLAVKEKLQLKRFEKLQRTLSNET